MNKTYIILIVMGMFMISCVSAVTIYAGECLPINLSELESLDNVVYDVVGNSSNLEGLTIELNGTIANICTVSNYKPDNFTILFIDDSTKEVVKEIHHYSSGSSNTKTITEYINKYITEYKDKIIIDDEEIQRLNDELKKRQDEIYKRNRALILSLVGFLALLCIIMFFIYKLVKKIKDAQK